MSLREHDNQAGCKSDGMNTRESATIALALNDPGFWIYFVALGVMAVYAAWAGSMLGLGLSVGAILGAVTGRASMTNNEVLQ